VQSKLTVTVGHGDADFAGKDHLALQAAVDYVRALGGGVVRILPGTYEMGNSLFLRTGLQLVGAGEGTILRKGPSAATKLVDDTDWYDTQVTVEDASIFRVGGGILLRGKCPHYAKQQFVKRTVVAIEGNVLTIDRDPRENFWIDMEAEAATLFPVVSGDQVNDILIASLTIDGNRLENENLNGNYGGGLFLQDCDRIAIRDVTTRDNNGDGMSWQVCDDVIVEGCRSLNNADLGLHPGSGSQRPVVRDCVIRGCDQGFFFCWGVKHGLVEGNLIEDSGKYGISIGHRDTENVVRGNAIRRSGVHGVLFREHPVALRDPHRNLFEDNLIEDSGTEGDCVAIEMLGTAENVVLRNNRIVDTREATEERRRIGIRLGKGVQRLTIEGGEYVGMEEEVVQA
jgi:hypothetical protein